MGISTAFAAALALDREDLAGGVDTGRGARIADLRTQYQNGTYEVDASELSRKIIDAHLEIYPSRGARQLYHHD